MLKTERLLLRPWCEDDAEELFELARDPKVGPAAGWPPHAGVEESAAVIRDVLMMSDSFAIIERATGALVGAMALKHPEISELARPGEAELATGSACRIGAVAMPRRRRGPRWHTALVNWALRQSGRLLQGQRALAPRAGKARFRVPIPQGMRCRAARRAPHRDLPAPRAQR